jgi:hypothetical protein
MLDERSNSIEVPCFFKITSLQLRNRNETHISKYHMDDIDAYDRLPPHPSASEIDFRRWAIHLTQVHPDVIYFLCYKKKL